MILKKIFYFPLVKILLGILAIVATIAIGEVIREFVLSEISISQNWKNAIVGCIQIGLALSTYIFLFRYYEKRKIKELNISGFWPNAFIGFITGLSIQSLVILILYLSRNYSITQINPVSFLIPGFISAIVAGFIMEIILRGIIFRITEEWLGSFIALLISASLFAIMHGRGENATILSATATTLQAGLLISSVYIFSRNLWLPIFLHFSWDFAEPAIFGGINPGISVNETLFTGRITGPQLLTGGEAGPGNSIQAAIFCLAAAAIFLWLAKRKDNFIKPFWMR